MLSENDKDYIRKTFLSKITDVEKRSKIMAVASTLSEDEEDQEDAYLLCLGYLMQPENEKELEADYLEFFGGNAIYLPESDKK
jgi:hypothetical protein